MIYNFQNPSWIKELHNTDHAIESIKERLKRITSKNPVITVCIIAHNEERNIVRCLDTLSRSKTTVPFDIIVVNNNSTDGTQKVLDRLEVPSFFQPLQGCGAAREMGQQKAAGKYVLQADADCLYPPHWIDLMYKSLNKRGVVAVYGRHSFLGNDQVPRWKYMFFEWGKNIMHEIRHLKRPYLNTYGMSFGYIKELGLKEGYVSRNIRGEDGRLCFDLMKYGKIKLVRNRKSKVWTEARSFTPDGNLFKAVKERILYELVQISTYFKAPAPHDTKTSENIDLTYEQSLRMIKNKFKNLIN